MTVPFGRSNCICNVLLVFGTLCPNTVNFYVKNNAASQTTKLKLFLAQREEDRLCMPSGAEFLHAKEAKGLLLFRFLVTDTSSISFPKIKQAQKSLRLLPVSCDPSL